MRPFRFTYLPMKYLILLLLFCFGTGSLYAQDSTTVRTDTLRQSAAGADSLTIDLLADLTDQEEAQPLLPHKMLFTQRAFWGPKGLLRVMNLAPLTSEGRIKELKIRRKMLGAHQIGGFITLAGFVAQGILGAKLYNAQGQEYIDTKRWHERSATFINIAYGTTMALSLTTPPPAVGARKGFTTIKLHKYLAIVHLTGIVATNILAGMIDEHYNLKPWHRAAAYTTFGTYAASVVALTF